MNTEFSFRTRAESLGRFKKEEFDLLVIGGGITGTAVARDAASRGMKVALVEKQDFAYGTSSRSSKLIHGGLRYLKNFEFGLVFEALAERSLLLKSAPHVVRPLPFYYPVYEGDTHGKGALSMGLWLYDLLSLFRAPGFHKNLSSKALSKEIPFLKTEGLQGGYRYFDASMWDDVMAVQTARAANELGAAIVNYAEAVTPIWQDKRIVGFEIKDQETGTVFPVRAKQVAVCAGPWIDQMGKTLSPEWRPWLNPSKGVHLVFDLKKIPISGAMVMNESSDDRLAFVIPRPDLGQGVVIVGTTDGPVSGDPDRADIEKADVDYLLGLLNRYFPSLALKSSDILSAYVGVRPLFATAEGQPLQKVSREHHIAEGPGGTLLVAGGKYTTHRRMAQEIVDFAIQRRDDASWGKSQTRGPINENATGKAVERARFVAKNRGLQLPEPLWERYGSDAMEIWTLSPAAAMGHGTSGDPEGFPCLEGQLRFAIRTEMVIHLKDFYLRRVPLFASRADQGLPWAEALGRAWAQVKGVPAAEVAKELDDLRAELARRSAWRAKV